MAARGATPVYGGQKRAEDHRPDDEKCDAARYHAQHAFDRTQFGGMFRGLCFGRIILSPS